MPTFLDINTLMKTENLDDVSKLRYFDETTYVSQQKFDNIKKSIDAIKNKELYVNSLPPFYSIEPTNHCNLRCVLCPSGKMDKNIKRGYMKFEEYKNIIDKIADTTIAITLLHWGEPTLHRDIIKFISYACKKDIRTILSSNFSLRYKEGFIEKLAESGLDILNIDLDGISQNVYEKYRVGGNVSIVKENLKLFCSLKHKTKTKIWVTMIISKYNEHEIAQFKNFCSALPIDNISLNKLQLNPKSSINWLPENLELRYNNYLYPEGKKEYCSRMYFDMSIDWNYKIPTCCLAYGDVNTVGNLATHSIPEIWNNEYFQSMRSVFSNQKPYVSLKTLCHMCQNDLGSQHIKHYENTLAITL